VALIKCPDCGTDVSDAAPACPKCGRPTAAASMYTSTRKPPPIKQKKNASGGFVLLVLILMGLWLYNKASPGDGKPDSASAAQGSATPVASDAPLAMSDLTQRIGTIRNVTASEPPSTENGSQFLVAVKADSVFQGGETAEDVLHSLHNHIGSATYAGVSVKLVATLVDRYGRTSQTPLLKLAYTPDDVSKIAFENVTTFDILNLAKVTALDPSAWHIVIEECTSTDSLAKYAKEFCEAAANAPLASQATDQPAMNASASSDAAQPVSSQADVSTSSDATDPEVLSAQTAQYAAAIQSAVMQHWKKPDNLPNAPCEVHIVQLPGGDVQSATVDPGCPYDDDGKRSVENAVLRSQPLPYKDFENVFRRDLVFTFNP
jgi:hypothetical protein